jgi:hypothetical protein
LRKVEYSLLSFVLRTYASPARWERRQLIQLQRLLQLLQRLLQLKGDN